MRQGIYAHEAHSIFLAGNNPNDQRTDTHEFMAIEMIDRRIRFSWNVGAGTQHITHNVTLETAFGTGLGIASQVNMC